MPERACCAGVCDTSIVRSRLAWFWISCALGAGAVSCSYGQSLGNARVTVNDSTGACFLTLDKSERREDGTQPTFCLDPDLLAYVTERGSLAPTEFAVGDCVVLRDYHPTFKIDKKVRCPS